MLTLLLVVCVVSLWAAVYFVLQSFHGILGFLWQLYLGWSLIAGKDLYDHARRVWISIEQKDLEECRMRTGYGCPRVPVIEVFNRNFGEQ